MRWKNGRAPRSAIRIAREQLDCTGDGGNPPQHAVGCPRIIGPSEAMFEPATGGRCGIVCALAFHGDEVEL